MDSPFSCAVRSMDSTCSYAIHRRFGPVLLHDQRGGHDLPSQWSVLHGINEYTTISITTELSQISLDPPKTALSQALGPELTILSADADHQCPYTTRQLLNIIDVLSYVHSTTFRSITLSSSPPVTWTDEAVYSLNLIAALTCRLLAYPYHKFVQLQSLVEHYKDVIRERLPFELGLASPTVTKAFVDGDVWPKDVLVELGIVEENLGDEMKAYECEMED